MDGIKIRDHQTKYGHDLFTVEVEDRLVDEFLSALADINERAGV